MQESLGEAEGQPPDNAAALRRQKAELAAMLERITRACLLELVSAGCVVATFQWLVCRTLSTRMHGGVMLHGVYELTTKCPQNVLTRLPLHVTGAEHAVALRHQQTASDIQSQRWAQQTPSHAQPQQQPSSPDGATTVRTTASSCNMLSKLVGLRCVLRQFAFCFE